MSVKKKVGIITLPGYFNYGNRLQNYAVASIFEKWDIEPTSLYLGNRPNLIRQLKAVGRKLLGREIVDPESLMTDIRKDAFLRFDGLHSRLDLSKINVKLVDEFNYFVVGSDQVWNPALITYNEDWYFLDFARPEQRIALSPSLGLDSLTARQSNIIIKGLKNFSRVSVREQRGAELIKQCSGTDAEVICDPTLVLSAKEWRAVADGRYTPEEPYVFTYLLGGSSSEAAATLEVVTDRGQVPVVPLSDRQKPGELDAGPAEFIDLIDNASHVVTDSFHAAVFSSILETPLTIVHREGGASMFSRLEQLTQMLGIEEKVYGSDTFDLALAGDYKGVSEAISCERERFMDFLEGCLDG